jgi:general stress protein 26
MNPVRFTRGACTVVVLVLSVLALFSDARAQEGEVVVPPRDTLLAVARDMMEQARICVLITLDESGHPRARAMDPFLPDENWVVWMGTDRVTRKVAEIRNDPRVTLYYSHPQGAGYVSLYGTARLVEDPEAKQRWWKQEWERFYPDKASYILIAVTPERLEVVDFMRGLMGDPKTWKPASVEF